MQIPLRSICIRVNLPYYALFLDNWGQSNINFGSEPIITNGYHLQSFWSFL